jgi:hypothetical protein
MSAKVAALLLLALGTQGCASMFYGSTQEVRLEAPAQSAVLRAVKDQRFDTRWTPDVAYSTETVQLPATVHLRRCASYKLRTSEGEVHVVPETSLPVLLAQLPLLEIVDLFRDVCPRRFPAVIEVAAQPPVEAAAAR